MKGPETIPNQSDLLGAYNEIQISLLHDKTMMEARVAQLSAWTRLDPRLAEILVFIVSKRWTNLNPCSLNQNLKMSIWSSAFGVISEMAIILIPKKDRGTFRAWQALAMNGVAPANNELFFLGLFPTGSSRAIYEVTLSLKSYQKWGYLGADLMINKAASRSDLTTIAASQRRIALAELILKKERISVEDYMEKLKFHVSRRQAERDLKGHSSLVGKGNTRRKIYRAKTNINPMLNPNAKAKIDLKPKRKSMN